MNDIEAGSGPRIQHILFPSDLSPASDRALAHARLLASRLGARMTLYNALEVPGPRWQRTDDEAALVRTVAGEVRSELAARAATVAGPSEVVVDAEQAHPACLADIAVLRHIHTTRPDLVVMASHREGDLRAFFLGSVAQEVLAHAGCPVLVVGPGCGPAPGAYGRIVVPTDFSEASRRALPMAVMLAQRFDAELVVVHVVPRLLLTALADNPHALAAAVPSTDQVRAFVRDVQGTRIRPRVEQGSVWRGIVEVAREEAADLVVMAINGADSLGERVLGSQTERVVRHAACPVLAV